MAQELLIDDETWRITTREGAINSAIALLAKYGITLEDRREVFGRHDEGLVEERRLVSDLIPAEDDE